MQAQRRAGLVVRWMRGGCIERRGECASETGQHAPAKKGARWFMVWSNDSV